MELADDLRLVLPFVWTCCYDHRCSLVSGCDLFPMEGNYCYKFSTIRNFLELTQQPPVSRIVDVGANIGDISLLMHEYFPAARIFGFEAVPEYLELARQRTAHVREIALFHRAVTCQHLFRDDLGTCSRDTREELRILKGQPSAGPGWLGGSMVVAADHELANRPEGVPGFEQLNIAVEPITLAEILTLTGVRELDLLKMDCEGCEHSAIGGAPTEVLQRIRFIVGEYHGIARFFRVMRHKLFQTHKVSLIGDRHLGAFFAERLDGCKDGILKFDKTGMLQARSWLGDEPMEWHIFNDAFVLPHERFWHALPP